MSRDVVDRRGIRVALSAEGQRLRRTVVADRRRLLAASLAEVEVSPLLDERLRELARALAAWRGGGSQP